jgi:hypothetical protein
MQLQQRRTSSQLSQTAANLNAHLTNHVLQAYITNSMAERELKQQPKGVSAPGAKRKGHP